MRCCSFLVVFCLFYVNPSVADNQLDIAGLLEIGIRFVVLNLRKAETITLIKDSTTLVLPDSVKNVTVGSAKLENFYLYGFNTLDITSLSASNLDAPDDSSKTNLCLGLTADRLGLSTLYDADIGIINEIPVYGIGEINLALSKIKIDLCTDVYTKQNFTELYVDELSIQLQVHDSPTGLANGISLESILETMINSYHRGISITLTEKEINDLKQLLKELLQIILSLLDSKGVNLF
ncbi:hypothetical protein NQ318_003772 [Aromia moschata]|uniref:Uncharacterized protein n=1 Tax=Aromia moschata TaxID=1265417 RepID=A0AAV8YJK9_9CUCU|nr:hypothetical protein NQ318_003772 [Aromia moschata]